MTMHAAVDVTNPNAIHRDMDNGRLPRSKSAVMKVSCDTAAARNVQSSQVMLDKGSREHAVLQDR
jgi:hypothetical protein